MYTFFSVSLQNISFDNAFRPNQAMLQVLYNNSNDLHSHLHKSTYFCNYLHNKNKF